MNDNDKPPQLPKSSPPMTTPHHIVASNRASRPPKPPKPPDTSHLPPWHDRNFQCSEEQRSLAQKFVSACKQNNIEEVKHLLNEALVPVNSGESGCCGHFPAIMEAIKLGHVELTTLLLLRGAKPEHEECMGPPCSPLISCGLQKLQKLKNVGGRTQLQNEKIISALLLHYYSKFWGKKSSDWNLGEIRAIEWWRKSCPDFSKKHLGALLLFLGIQTYPDKWGSLALQEAIREGNINQVRNALNGGGDVINAVEAR